MKLAAVVTLLSTIAWIQAATAADAHRPSLRESEDNFRWDGPYVGAHLGAGWSSLGWSTVVPSTVDQDGSGLIGGIQGGVNKQLGGSWVGGIESDFSWSNIGGERLCPNPVYTCGHEFKWGSTLRVRLGYALDRILIYGTAGAALTQMVEVVRPVDEFGGTFSQIYVGAVAGAGVEYAVTDHITTKIEYRYFSLSARTEITPPSASTFRPMAQEVIGGFNFHW